MKKKKVVKKKAVKKKRAKKKTWDDYTDAEFEEMECSEIEVLLDAREADDKKRKITRCSNFLCECIVSKRGGSIFESAYRNLDGVFCDEECWEEHVAMGFSDNY